MIWIFPCVYFHCLQGMQMDFFQMYAGVELQISLLFAWPQWITRTILALCGAIGIVGLFQLDQLRQLNNALSTAGASQEVTWKFRKFQLSYLVVYLTIMLADWLQGTNMYTLYSVSNLMELSRYLVLRCLVIIDMLH